MLPLSTPPLSTMRDLGLAALPVLSSIVLPEPYGRHLRHGAAADSRQQNQRRRLMRNHGWSPRSSGKGMQARFRPVPASVSISTLLPARAVRISVAVSGNSLAK